MYPSAGGGFLKGGLSFLKNIDFAGLLDGTSKTLSVINQAIPVYYQVKPIVSNLKTLTQISNVMGTSGNDEAITEEAPTNFNSIFYMK